MKRIGECKKCGKCCTHLYFGSNAALPEGMKEYLEWHGIEVKKFAENRHEFKVNLKCKHLKADNTCAIWGKPERPKFCADWLEEKDLSHRCEGCGFNFIEG